MDTKRGGGAPLNCTICFTAVTSFIEDTYLLFFFLFFLQPVGRDASDRFKDNEIIIGLGVSISIICRPLASLN